MLSKHGFLFFCMTNIIMSKEFAPFSAFTNLLFTKPSLYIGNLVLLRSPKLYVNVDGLVHVDVQFIRRLLQKSPCTYLDEIQSKLEHQQGIFISIPTLIRTLQRIRFSNKSVSVQALERNDIQRSAFMNYIAEIMHDPNMAMFIDEAAKNDKTVARNNGWSMIGTRVIQHQVFVRGTTWSILPVMTMDALAGSINC